MNKLRVTYSKLQDYFCSTTLEVKRRCSPTLNCIHRKSSDWHIISVCDSCFNQFHSEAKCTARNEYYRRMEVDSRRSYSAFPVPVKYKPVVKSLVNYGIINSCNSSRLFAVIMRVLCSHLRCSNAVWEGQKYLLDCTITDVLSATKTSAVPGLWVRPKTGAS
jgi:hypothetical protein